MQIFVIVIRKNQATKLVICKTPYFSNRSIDRRYQAVKQQHQSDSQEHVLLKNQPYYKRQVELNVIHKVCMFSRYLPERDFLCVYYTVLMDNH